MLWHQGQRLQMNNFDFSRYDDSEVVEEPKSQSNKKIRTNEKMDFTPKLKFGDFDFDKYDISQETPEKEKSLLESIVFAHEKGVENFKDIYPDFAKGVLSGASLGLTENVEALKPKDSLTAKTGEFIGAVAPIGIISKSILLPIKAFSGLMKFGNIGKAALETVHSVGTGVSYEAAREIGHGEDLNVTEIGLSGVMFGVLDGLFRAGKTAYKWLKDLKPAQQAEILVEGKIPRNLSPDDYKFYESEVVPELQKIAESQYKKSYEKAIEDANISYKQELDNVRAKHESDLIQKTVEKKMSAEEESKSLSDYQNKIKQIAAEHEQKVSEIQRANQEAQLDFQKAQNEYQVMQARQAAVEESIRLQPGEENLPYRNAPSNNINSSAQNEVGNVISSNEITNTTNAGKANIEAVRANDQMDYKIVNDAYNISREMNAQVETIHPNLAMELLVKQKELLEMPNLSPPQEQLLKATENLLNRIATLGPEGSITVLHPISNNILEEQAKVLRYYMDFHFEHGNARGILSPSVRSIENSIESAAEFTGHRQAAEANKTARTLYREWAEDYDNPFIRKYRDHRKFDYSDTFKNSLQIDEFNALKNILDRSNAGQQLSQVTKRALVEKQLLPFLKNPHVANPVEFEHQLKELSSVLSRQETKSIRQVFKNQRNTPPFMKEAPVAQKLKELPEAKIPLYKGKGKEISEITEVRIPKKKDITETLEMKAASKLMKVQPEQAMKMANNVSGLKKMKEVLPEKLFDKVAKRKVKDIFYEGNVERKFTGNELYDIMNKGENYSMLSELLGEDVASELLVTSKELAKKKATVDMFKKAGTRIGTLKTLILFGIL